MRGLLKLLLLCALVLGTAAASRAGDATRVGGYDFAYLLGGDAAARPVQVFDDGQHTFFQFRTDAPTPAIFATQAGVPHLVTPAQDGPYLRVPQLHGRWLLQVGRAQATAIHARGERADAPPILVRSTSAASQPQAGPELAATGRLLVALPALASPTSAREAALEHHSYAQPLRGDRVHWSGSTESVEHALLFARGTHPVTREAQQAIVRIVQRAGPGARYTVIGREDDSDKEGLERSRAEALRDTLRRAGVAAERIQLRSGPMKAAVRAGWWECTLLVEDSVSAAPPRAAAAAAAGSPPRTASTPSPEPPAGGFTLLPSDGTIAGAVRRWAHALGYHLVWDAPAPLDAPITGEALLPAPRLLPALELLLQGLQAQGYALEVTLHANRVIRFTGASAQPVPSAPTTRPPDAPRVPPSLLRAGAGAGATP